ncbi:MAG: quinoprotein, partial [Alphaproteobacteria bacterium]|nr:quinoprotein [Alphaproteobacteria bacterium]MBU1830693.1 quinoprotein [Alphaproteobacteria bacterium]
MIGQAGKAGLFCAVLALTACGAGREEILSGQRLHPREGLVFGSVQTETANRVEKISLGQQVSRAAWPTTGAGRLHASGHNAFTSGVPSVAWTAPIGQGNSRKMRLSVDPVAANGLVVAMDAVAQLTAVSAASGAPVWSVDLTPAGEKPGKASGGALAIEGTTVYATIGYGELIA